jgi:hypothetical protein
VEDRSSRHRSVATGGLRNEVPLTEAEIEEAVTYAMSLGMPKKAIRYSENMNTAYSHLFGREILYIGTDVLPASEKGLPANSRISMRGAIAHEIVGHRAADQKGKSQSSDVREEAQASIRAARFAPDLTQTEKCLLLRDAVARLKRVGINIRDVKGKLWINQL